MTRPTRCCARVSSPRSPCTRRRAICRGPADAARASLEILEAQPNADSALIATALSARVRADLFLGHGLDRQAAERALELEAAATPPVAVDARVPFKLGQWLRYVDDFAGARGYLELAERTALDEGDESSLANILLNRTLLECWSGNWSIAAALGDQTHELFQLTGINVEASNVWRAYVDAHYGRVDAVRAAALQAGERRGADRAHAVGASARSCRARGR